MLVLPEVMGLTYVGSGAALDRRQRMKHGASMSAPPRTVSLPVPSRVMTRLLVRFVYRELWAAASLAAAWIYFRREGLAETSRNTWIAEALRGSMRATAAATGHELVSSTGPLLWRSWKAPSVDPLSLPRRQPVEVLYMLFMCALYWLVGRLNIKKWKERDWRVMRRSGEQEIAVGLSTLVSLTVLLLREHHERVSYHRISPGTWGWFVKHQYVAVRDEG